MKQLKILTKCCVTYIRESLSCSQAFPHENSQFACPWLTLTVALAFHQEESHDFQTSQKSLSVEEPKILCTKIWSQAVHKTNIKWNTLVYLRNFLHRFIFEGGECALPHVAADLVSSCMFHVSELQSEEMNLLVIEKLLYSVRINLLFPVCIIFLFPVCIIFSLSHHPSLPE